MRRKLSLLSGCAGSVTSRPHESSGSTDGSHPGHAGGGGCVRCRGGGRDQRLPELGRRPLGGESAGVGAVELSPRRGDNAYRQGDRAARDLRRPGGDRPWRTRGCSRSWRPGTATSPRHGAADGDRRDPAGHRRSPHRSQPVLDTIAENAARSAGPTTAIIPPSSTAGSILVGRPSAPSGAVRSRRIRPLTRGTVVGRRWSRAGRSSGGPPVPTS